MCEVLSPSTTRRDHREKLPVRAREHGAHLSQPSKVVRPGVAGDEESVSFFERSYEWPSPEAEVVVFEGNASGESRSRMRAAHLTAVRTAMHPGTHSVTLL